MPEDRIDARPSKRFFVDFLTKDIGLAECILDLIDNSIDSLIRRNNLSVKEYLEGEMVIPYQDEERPTIDITLSKDEFTIKDNCGGISIEEAKSKVFRFGLPEETAEIDNDAGLSVYGVGMKRAFFKIGKLIKIYSNTDREHFSVVINVNDWLASPSDVWDFYFSDQGESINNIYGTSITINNLNDLASIQFGLTAFAAQLQSKISSTYSLFILKGVRITINNQIIANTLPQIARSERLPHARQLFHIDDVEVLIFASVSDKSENTPNGWSVFCNGRMILEKDKTKTTGWEVGLPAWHTKFNHFVGYAYFWSNDEHKLPWTTTKVGIDVDSYVYKAALNKMIAISRPIINFLSGMYPGELPAEGVDQRKALSETTSTTLTSLPVQESLFVYKAPKRPQNPLVSIQYKKRKSEIENACRLIGNTNLAAGKVGEYTFDYFVKMESK